MDKLSKQQRTINNEESFRKAFVNLHLSAVAVVLVRTREPYRAIESLKDFALREKNLDFKEWWITFGWGKYSKDSIETDETTCDPVSALKAVHDVNNKQQWGDGVYVMAYPHLVNMNKNPIFICLLKEYARIFAENYKRIVLITPPTYELPTELEDDIAILDFNPPSYAELKEVFIKLSKILPEDKKPKFTKDEIDQIISIGAGMTQPEFENSVSRAFVENRENLPNVSVADMCNVLSTCKSEVIKKTDILEIMEPVSIDEVGGLQPLKDWLEGRKHCFTDEARKFGISSPRGITLVGPPGGGKSLVAKATAHMLQLPLIRFDVSRVFQSLVGSSEQRIRNTLKIVETCSPCCLLLDEIDKVFGGTVAGLQGDSGVGQRILGTILTWLQESPYAVFVIATANRIEYLPPEMMRRGRMDEVFSVQMPDEQERLEIFRIHLRKRGHDPDKIDNLEVAVNCSAGYVGAEIEACVKDALIEVFAESRNTKTKPVITGNLIAKQLGNLKPLSVAFKDQFDAMSEWAANNARPANSTALLKPKISPKAGQRNINISTGTLDLDG